MDWKLSNDGDCEGCRGQNEVDDGVFIHSPDVPRSEDLGRRSCLKHWHPEFCKFPFKALLRPWPVESAAFAPVNGAGENPVPCGIKMIAFGCEVVLPNVCIICGREASKQRHSG